MGKTARREGEGVPQHLNGENTYTMNGNGKKTREDALMQMERLVRGDCFSISTWGGIGGEIVIYTESTYG